MPYPTVALCQQKHHHKNTEQNQYGLPRSGWKREREREVCENGNLQIDWNNKTKPQLILEQRERDDDDDDDGLEKGIEKSPTHPRPFTN